MKIATWNIDRGGGGRVGLILDKIKEINCDTFIITGFRTNHNKNTIIDGLKEIGYKYITYKKVGGKHKDTVLIASKYHFEVIKHSGASNQIGDYFLTIRQGDFVISGMNLVHSITQKSLMELIVNEVKTYANEKHLVVGNMEAAKNYAYPNSLKKKMCKKYINFEELGIRNCLEDDFNSGNVYTWKTNKQGEYNVDFIFLNNNIEFTRRDCCLNTLIKEEGLSSHAIISININN